MKSPLNQLGLRYEREINELRELLKLPEKYEKQAILAKKELDRIYLPFAIQGAKADLDLLPKSANKIKRDGIKKNHEIFIDKYRKLEPQNIDSNGNLLIEVDKVFYENFRKTKKQSEKLKHSTYHKIHIEKAVLFNLISYFEQLFSEISHIVLKQHPEILKLSDKKLTFDELNTFSTLDDAKDYLISQEIEKLLFRPLSDYFNFFEKVVFKTTFADLSEFRNDLVEIKERRNLLIHNGGEVNSKYLNTVDKKFQKKYKIKEGVTLKLDNTYLENSIQKIELIGMEIIMMASIKFQGDENRNVAIWDMSNHVIYDTFVSKNYFLGEHLSMFILDTCDKYLTNMQEDYIRLNYWHILKKQKKMQPIRDEIIKYDVSSKNSLIKLCYYSLLDDYKNAYKFIIPSLRGGDNFDVDSYNTFQILENLRKQKKAKAIIKKYKESRKKK